MQSNRIARTQQGAKHIYKLPTRNWGKLSLFTGPLAIIALAIIGEALFDIAVGIQAALDQQSADPIFNKVLPEIFQLLPGVFFFVLTSALHHSRTTLIVDTSEDKPRLIAKERYGLLSAKRTISTPIASLHIAPFSHFTTSTGNPTPSFEAETSHIDSQSTQDLIETSPNKPWHVLAGVYAKTNYLRPSSNLPACIAALYAPSVLMEVVEEVQAEFQRLSVIQEAPSTTQAAEHTPESETDSNLSAHTLPTANAQAAASSDAPTPHTEPAPADMPEKAKADVVRNNNEEWTITLRAPGLFKGKGGFMAFGIIWTGFTIVHSIFMLGGMISNQPAALAFGIPFYIVFYAVGIFMLRSGIHAGTCTTNFDVIGSTLLVTEQSKVRQRQFTTEASNIESIKVAHSGVSSNDTPLLDLQIKAKEKVTVGNAKSKGKAKKKIQMLRERPDEELRWLAASLRHALQLPTETDH